MGNVDIVVSVHLNGENGVQADFQAYTVAQPGPKAFVLILQLRGRVVPCDSVVSPHVPSCKYLYKALLSADYTGHSASFVV